MWDPVRYRRDAQRESRDGARVACRLATRTVRTDGARLSHPGGCSIWLVRAGVGHRLDFCPVLAVGDKAPDFKLPTTGGQELTLGDALQKHRAVIFLFYVLDFTGG
ncbi:MAG: redoxin domain-containing protein [Chloroflexi bacterium]|nr:MAG: redoxin domain-containing protein [Chloroflexota bacterium]